MHFEKNSKQLTEFLKISGSREAKVSSELEPQKNIESFLKHFLFILKSLVLPLL